MAPEIWTAILSFAACLIGTMATNSKAAALLEERIKQLEKKVDKHNHVVERVYCLERDQSVIEEKIQVANHRIEDLEERNER